MLLSFDVEADATAEHDQWHTQEHLPERLSIPGFLRGTRWVALRGEPRYLVLYEVEALSTLSSPPYLERLNHPSAWTSSIMPRYRGMQRGFCSVLGSFGFGMGYACAAIRFKEETADRLHSWLLRSILPGLPGQSGIGSAHLLHAVSAPSMTSEQRLRGADSSVDSVVMVTGYELSSVEQAAQAVLSGLAAKGCVDATLTIYQVAYSLARAEIDN